MSKYPGLVKFAKDGHTYLIDGLNLDLGGKAPDVGRQETMAQKAALYTPEKEELRGNMPGKVDEAKWSEAKSQAKKSHPDWSDDNPRLWKIISTIYKNMGGKFSKEIEKSLAVINGLEKITPTFIADPRLWLVSLKKSGVDYENPGAVYGNLGLTIKCYAELGGQLIKSSVLDLVKSGEHKYTGKVALPGGGFRYIYPGEETGGKPAAAQSAAPKKSAPAATPAKEAKKGPTSAYAKTIEALSKKNDADARASLQNVDYDHLSGMHGEMSAKDPKRALVAQAMQEKRRSADKLKAEAKEKPPVEKSQNAFETFEKKNSQEVKASLRKSHPEWDAETLESRTVSQLRQLFKFQ